jgi:hypothetical protein
MKLILLLTAIYSLIFHQCHKNAREMASPGKQMSMAQRTVTRDPASSLKLYQQQLTLRSDSIERLGFVSSNHVVTHVK